MAFFGYEFIYNGIPSSNYGLVISNMGSSGKIESPQGSTVNLITKKILRNPIEFLYGVEQGPILEFDIEFYSENPISAIDRNIIGAWLFGRQKFEKLQILQGDLEGVVFNCLIIEAKVAYVGNLAVGWTARVRCDSPFAWGKSITINQDIDTGFEKYIETRKIFNPSSDNYYTYPLLAFTVFMAGDFILTNDTEDSAKSEIRQFKFTGLKAQETITVDNKHQIITSSLGILRIGKFNYNWFRLLPGINNITFNGYLTNYNITFPVAKKVGG